jgi:hypothetical protein
MRKLILSAAVLLGATFAASCSDQTALTPTEGMDAAVAGSGRVQQTQLNFSARLDGSQEVPPANTDGRGNAFFQVSDDGTAITFVVEIRRIENVTMAHIHLGPAGANGPVVVWLRPSAPPPQLIPGPYNGIYAQGTFTAANLVGPLAGQPLSALIAHMQAGNTYVNVHTSQYPGGEIRGQIRRAAPRR